MPWILIKNNLKLMLRSKWILFLMVILPVITIALLSNAFKEMMDTSDKMISFRVGYRISDDSLYKDMLPELIKECEKNDITLQEYPEGEIDTLLKEEVVAVFVEITNDNSYTVYKSTNKDVEAGIMESIFSDFFYQINEYLTTQAYLSENNITVTASSVEHQMIKEVLSNDPVPNSTDYYGIIYIVYFAWCGMISLVAVISSERKSAIPIRMRVTHLPKLSYYLGKFIPCSLAVFIEICSAWILSCLLLDIHWGRLELSIIIVFLLSMAVSAFGMVLFQLFRNVAISIVAGFVITWIAGFFGGSFEPYMYLPLPKVLIHSSPIYYTNRTLVEFSTKGSSDYLGICVLFLLGILVVFGVIGILLMNRKMEEQ